MEGLSGYRFEPILVGTIPPPVVNTLSAPNAMVFLPSGDLWVSYPGSNLLARYRTAWVGGRVSSERHFHGVQILAVTSVA